MERNTKYIVTSVIAILIIGGLFFAYRAGYRVTDKLSVGKVGALVITTPLPNTLVFIDDSQKNSVTKDGVTTVSVSPSSHTLIVSHAGYFPWKKDITVASDSTQKISPIFVAQNASGVIIPAGDPEYQKIKNSIDIHSLPTKAKPLVSKDKTTTLWVEDNAIIAQVGSTTTTVLQPDSIIRNISFYKNRPDAILFSTLTAVYAIEVDKTGGQNFMPVYTGQSPRFVATDPNFIYVLDNSVLMQVVI